MVFRWMALARGISGDHGGINADISMAAQEGR